MEEDLKFKIGDKVSWLGKAKISREGVILSFRTTPRTGRVWAQVQCTDSYKGQKSIEPKRFELGGQSRVR